MLLSCRARLALPASLLLLACAETQQPRVPSASPRPSATDEYVTLVPSVSVSKAPEPRPEKQAALDPNEDVMAEILAIPPGK